MINQVKIQLWGGEVFKHGEVGNRTSTHTWADNTL